MQGSRWSTSIYVVDRDCAQQLNSSACHHQQQRRRHIEQYCDGLERRCMLQLQAGYASPDTTVISINGALQWFSYHVNMLDPRRYRFPS
jgi:hypothetical protein